MNGTEEATIRIATWQCSCGALIEVVEDQAQAERGIDAGPERCPACGQSDRLKPLEALPLTEWAGSMFDQGVPALPLRHGACRWRRYTEDGTLIIASGLVLPTPVGGRVAEPQPLTDGDEAILDRIWFALGRESKPATPAADEVADDEGEEE